MPTMEHKSTILRFRYVLIVFNIFLGKNIEKFWSMPCHYDFLRTSIFGSIDMKLIKFQVLQLEFKKKTVYKHTRPFVPALVNHMDLKWFLQGKNVAISGLHSTNLVLIQDTISTRACKLIGILTLQNHWLYHSDACTRTLQMMVFTGQNRSVFKAVFHVDRKLKKGTFFASAKKEFNPSVSWSYLFHQNLLS